MVQRCVVSTCTTTFHSRGRKCKPEGLKCHGFPSSPGRLQTWINSIRTVNGSNWEPSRPQTARICSLHFAPSAYELERQDGVIKLRWNATPTIFHDPKNGDPPTVSPETDHPYSVAREDAPKLDQSNSQRKVLESIINARIPDHIYASRSSEPPLCKIQSTQSLDHRPSTPESDTVMFPTLRVELTEECDVINLDEDSSDAPQEIPARKVKPVPRKGSPVKTSGKLFSTTDNFVVGLPHGRCVQLVSLAMPPDGRPLEKNTFSDSEVDKLQIKRLTDHNRKLQEELNKIRGYAEKLLKQNERLRQQNRVTARAYRQIKKQMKKPANENLNNPFSDDESIREERLNADSDDDVLFSGTNSSSQGNKDENKRPPYAPVLQVRTKRNGTGNLLITGDLLHLLANDIPKESPQNDSASSGPIVVNKIVNV